VGELELNHPSGSSKQAWHIPDAACTVFELLMMGGKTARNMYSIVNNKEYCITLHLVGCTYKNELCVADFSTDDPQWYVKMLTFKNHQDGWGISYLSKHLSSVKCSHVPACTVKLMFCWLSPLYKIGTML